MAHAHAHPAPDAITLDAAFRWAVVLNIGYTNLEAGIGLWIGSLALLADAAHNLTDVADLLIAWAAAAAAERAPTARFSYGFGRATILAALANAIVILLLIRIGALTWEAVHRLADPPAVPDLVVLVGIGVNTGTALLFQRHRAHYLHIWSLRATRVGLTAHLVMPRGVRAMRSWTTSPSISASTTPRCRSNSATDRTAGSPRIRWSDRVLPLDAQGRERQQGGMRLLW